MRRPPLLVLTLLAVTTAVGGCSGASPAAPAPTSAASASPSATARVNPGWEPKNATSGLTLASTDFSAGGEFPASIELNSYGCNGKNVRPELHWKGAPAGTKSFVVTFTAGGGGPLDRWMAFDIPTTVTALPAAPGDAGPPAGKIGNTSVGGSAMLGPCSLEGQRWELWFTVYAMDTSLGLPAESTTTEVFEAGLGHVLAAAELNGYRTYQGG